MTDCPEDPFTSDDTEVRAMLAAMQELDDWFDESFRRGNALWDAAEGLSPGAYHEWLNRQSADALRDMVTCMRLYI
jgi:hypothetical protein